MAGTTEGGLKAVQTIKAKYGDDWYKKIAKRGGEAGTGHKFGHGMVDPSVIGKKGGAISRRGPGKIKPKEELFFVQDETINDHIIEPFKKEKFYQGWFKRSEK